MYLAAPPGLTGLSRGTDIEVVLAENVIPPGEGQLAVVHEEFEEDGQRGQVTLDRRMAEGLRPCHLCALDEFCDGNFPVSRRSAVGRGQLPEGVGRHDRQNPADRLDPLDLAMIVY
ncbi:hypothetical protein [Muricoccus aerilatus]|uniref:hypothetical protein n=1 Tax=Muricoccus aerilatus TaxID=452982 RepID=UPI000A6E132B|nr:hypothetical protein [Roseomonas aerilata]